MQPVRFDLVEVAQQRQSPRAGQMVQLAPPLMRRSARRGGNIDVDGPVSFDHRVGCEAFRSPVAPPRGEAEAPPMRSTDEMIALDFPLSQQRSLMRTTTFERAQPEGGADDDDGNAVRRKRQRAAAFDLVDVGGSNERSDLHEMGPVCGRRAARPENALGAKCDCGRILFG